jgi:hypothetical protein
MTHHNFFGTWAKKLCDHLPKKKKKSHEFGPSKSNQS